MIFLGDFHQSESKEESDGHWCGGDEIPVEITAVLVFIIGGTHIISCIYYSWTCTYKKAVGKTQIDIYRYTEITGLGEDISIIGIECHAIGDSRSDGKSEYLAIDHAEITATTQVCVWKVSFQGPIHVGSEHDVEGAGCQQGSSMTATRPEGSSPKILLQEKCLLVVSLLIEEIREPIWGIGAKEVFDHVRGCAIARG